MKETLFIKEKFFNQKFKKHFHKNYSIGLITKGSHKLEIESDKLVIKNYEIKIINPYQAHFATEDSSWEYINFMPNFKTFATIFEEIYHKELKESLYFKNQLRDREAIRYFIKLYNSKQNSLEYQENLRIFISYLIENYSHKMYEKLDIDYPISKSIEYIHECFLEDITLQKLADISNLSKYHFIRLFKEKTSLTPHQYILNLRIEYAFKLIQKDMPLSLVAHTCGFSDQSHFIRVFKERFGFTPAKLK